MERTKIFSVLRIGAATLCLLMCAMTLGLWIRSHYRQDAFTVGGTPIGEVTISGSHGVVLINVDNIRNLNRLTFEVGDFEWEESGNFGFLLHTQDVNGINYMLVPHWYAASLFGGMAIALLLGWFRRFTMRSILIVTTIVCVTLGLMMQR